MSYLSRTNHPLLFIHIPKCAGTSVSDWYKSTFSTGFKTVGHAPLTHFDSTEYNGYTTKYIGTSD